MTAPVDPHERDAAAVGRAVLEILVELGIEADDVTPGARLRGDLELDSTETVEVTLELKRRLDVDVQLESGEDITVDGVCARVLAAGMQGA